MGDGDPFVDRLRSGTGAPAPKYRQFSFSPPPWPLTVRAARPA